MSNLELEWTKEWPTEVGLYLFYGGFKKSNIKKLSVCEVVKVRNSLVYMAAYSFLYKGESVGVFTPLNIELPDEALEGVHNETV